MTFLQLNASSGKPCSRRTHGRSPPSNPASSMCIVRPLLLSIKRDRIPSGNVVPPYATLALKVSTATYSPDAFSIRIKDSSRRGFFERQLFSHDDESWVATFGRQGPVESPGRRMSPHHPLPSLGTVGYR